MAKRELTDAAITAKAIKKRLSSLYPDVKFSVKSDNFSMGDSVDIKWTDGPTQKTIEAITDLYQCGSFDGSIDLYTYNAIDASLGCPGSKYVHCTRNRSTGLIALLEAKAAEYFSDFDPHDYHQYNRRINEIERMFFPYKEAQNIQHSSGNGKDSIISGLEYEIINDIDTRDNSKIFVVKVKTKVDDFSALREEMRNYGGYYSKFKRGFIFKENPSQKLAGVIEPQKNNSSETSVQPVISLIDKFGAVVIEEKDRFPTEDIVFCKEAERLYKLAYALHTEILEKARNFVNEHKQASVIGREYVSEYSGARESAGISNYENSIENDNLTFIDEICYYFRKKYNITIETPDWKVKNTSSSNANPETCLDIVPLNHVLDSIYEQMGGVSFDEKALAEMKDKMRSRFYNQDQRVWHLTIKGEKMILDIFYSSNKNYKFNKYEVLVDESHTAFFKALTHFEYGEAYLHQKYNTFTGCYCIREDAGIFDTHMISSNTIISVKVHKNGKVEINFRDSAKALQFAREYCGYIGLIAV